MGQYTLFGGDMTAPRRAVAEFWTPALLIEWPSRWGVFFSNLRHLLFPPPPAQITTPPAEFWPDVFVPERRMRFGALSQSALYHALLIAILASSPKFYILFPRVFEPIQLKDPYKNTKIVYYPVSEYLPPIHEEADSEPAEVEQKGDPVLAKQRIISVPRNRDNTTQTIITPSPLKLPSEVPLPNLVAWAPAPPPVPAATANSIARPVVLTPTVDVIAPPPDTSRPQLTAPSLSIPAAIAPAVSVDQVRSKLPSLATASPVAPPPALDQARSRVPQIGAAAPVAPPPATAQLYSAVPKIGAATAVAPAPSIEARLRSPGVATAAPVQPPPSVSGVRGVGDVKPVRLDPQVVPPAPDARAMSTLASGARASAVNHTAAAAVPPPVVPQATPGAPGRIIALGIRPVAPAGPIEVPQGTRRGTFGAGPEGRPDARGTPDIHGGGTKDGAGGNGKHDANSPAAGITVAAGPVDPGPVAVATNVPPVAAPSIAKANPDANAKALRAVMRPSLPADIARNTRPNPVAPPERQPGDEIFGAKKYYSMTLNMPNLTAGGSWIIRFAELHQTGPRIGELTAPVVTQKVDPGFPTELMRSGMRGTVVLYAVIHADGSVGEVRVLHGLDDRLDARAQRALRQWHFLPGTKNGAAVDLEAVVQIPFRPSETF